MAPRLRVPQQGLVHVLLRACHGVESTAKVDNIITQSRLLLSHLCSGFETTFLSQTFFLAQQLVFHTHEH